MSRKSAAKVLLFFRTAKLSERKEVCLLQECEQTQLIRKNQEDAERCEVANDETVGGIKGTLDGAMIGDFGTEHFLINHPPQEEAHEQTTYRQDEFGNQEIEQVEEAHTEELHIFPVAK